MKASTQYSDFKGTVAADTSNILLGNDLGNVPGFFKLDTKRFKVIGLSFYGVEKPSLSLLCVDLKKSTPEKEHIVKMMMDTNPDILKTLLGRMHIVLHNKYDDKYSDPNLNHDEEVDFSDFHEEEEE